MSTTTKIEWTERTWNPVTGCTKVSPGCDHCYAEGIARRFAGGKAFPNGFAVTLRPERLTDPLRWRKPARVFVNSMSDLFHADIPGEFVARVFAVMAATPQHTYQVLTKRHSRMRFLLGNDGQTLLEYTEDEATARALYDAGWPLPNVHVGVSVENQHWADIRIPALLDTPAAVRFLSCEPLLGPVDLLRGGWLAPDEFDRSGIGWVIVGGESGPGARPMELDWARSIVDDCAVGDVPVFVKQLGSAHGPSKGGDMETWPADLRVRQFPNEPSRLGELLPGVVRDLRTRVDEGLSDSRYTPNPPNEGDPR